MCVLSREVEKIAFVAQLSISCTVSQSRNEIITHSSIAFFIISNCKDVNISKKSNILKVDQN